MLQLLDYAAFVARHAVQTAVAKLVDGRALEEARERARLWPL